MDKKVNLFTNQMGVLLSIADHLEMYFFVVNKMCYDTMYHTSVQ